MVNNAVIVDDLHIRRGKTPVLHGLHLDIAPGMIVGLLGPSGSGKTTLMRAIVGVQVVTSGSVTVLGKPAGSAGLRSRVAYMTQQASIYDDLTIRQNLAYFARVIGAPRDDVDRVLERTRLTPYADRLAGTLSGGQESRVSLAGALLGTPELLVLDEPTVGLDPVLRVELWGLFRELASEGKSVLVSSHVMDEATKCDRLLLMRDGRIIADDTPTGLLEHTGAPDTEAAFLAVIAAHEEDTPPPGASDGHRHRRNGKGDSA